MKNDSINLLFICSRNQWRSPTAEKIYANRDRVNARSAGTSPNARRKVTAGDIKWADLIFVMEYKHLQKLKADFPDITKFKSIHTLQIEDNYRYMDPELVEDIEFAVDAILENV